MSKPLKQMMTDALRDRYVGVESACVVDLTGLDVVSTTRFRRTLREKSIRVSVVKNSLAARAFQGTPLEALGRSLEGPSALVSGGDSIIEVAKALVAAAKEYAVIRLKQAIVEGDPSLMTVEDVSRLKSRLELIGEVAMLIASPGRRVAGCIAGPQAKLAGCVKAIADRGEKEAA
jgi:large subunit ribosomal protein L10